MVIHLTACACVHIYCATSREGRGQGGSVVTLSAGYRSLQRVKDEKEVHICYLGVGVGGLT